MKLYLADILPDMTKAWTREFNNYSNITIHTGSIFELADKIDAIVSPANSYGWMNGGIDLKYSEVFGWDLQRRLQVLLKDKHQGELLVGQAEILETNHAKIKYLISAPTMRVPELLVESANPYLATRAALRLAVQEKLSAIAFPGMGTGVGKVPVNTCARQMRTAWDEVILNKVPRFNSLMAATQYHNNLVS